MDIGYYKTESILNGYDEENIEHLNDNGELLYTEHFKKPIYKEEKVFIKYTAEEIQANKINEIRKLQQELKESDYKIIKSYEYSLLEKTLPYNLLKLHTERESLRNKINELENELK